MSLFYSIGVLTTLILVLNLQQAETKTWNGNGENSTNVLNLIHSKLFAVTQLEAFNNIETSLKEYMQSIKQKQQKEENKRQSQANTSKSPSDNNDICLGKECIKVANTLLQNIDSSVDPCDNFYKFACGGFAENNPIPEDKSSVTPIGKLNDLLMRQLKQVLEEPAAPDEPAHFRKLKAYYKTCMDLETIEDRGLTPMEEIISAVGGWPVVEDSDPEDDWLTVLDGMRTEHMGSNWLLNIYVVQDMKNASIRTLYIDPAQFPIEKTLYKQGKNGPFIKKYYLFMQDVAQLYGAEACVAEDDMEAVLDFEMALAQASKSEVEKRQNYNDLNNVFTVEELEELFPKFPWMQYIDVCAPESFTLTNDRKLVLSEPTFVISLIELLETTPNRAVCETAGKLNAEIRELQHDLFKTLQGSNKPVDRYITCILDVNSGYVASEMIKYIKQEFIKMLNETKWSAKDLEKGIEKVEALTEFTGFPDELIDDAKLDELFGKIEVEEGNYLKSSLLMNKFSENYFFSKLDEPVNKKDWTTFTNVADVNAYYNSLSNSIFFPAAILQGGFFNANVPKYLNFAGIGSVIGHEISHGFDETGHQFDKDGNLNNWWSEEAIKDFEKKKDCIIDQFNHYTVLDGVHLKGNISASENLADFGGKKVSYRSYEMWEATNGKEPGLPGLNYTNRQLFWISMASTSCFNERDTLLQFRIEYEPHAPGQFRVNGPLSNLDMFAKDFNCPVGSNMNPEKKCIPW